MSEASLWQETTFLIATRNGPDERRGFIYRGLGVFKVLPSSLKGRRPPRWSVTHLGSGHQVALIDAHMVEAFNIATEIAECGEWDFDSLEGWRDRDPTLLKKRDAILLRHGEKCPEHRREEKNHDVARAIAEARA